MKIISKKVGTGDDAHYELAEEKIAKIKSVTLAATSYTYDTKAKKPAVTVKDSAGKVIAASNYTVTYTNNTNGTKYTYRIVAVTKLANSVSKTLKITYGKNAKATGYEIRYSLKSNMTGAKIIKVKGVAKVSANVTKLVKNKRYYVSVRCYKTVGKVTYYSTWSAAKNTVVKK